MGNMYEFAVTWNPLGGECQHKCSYCSTNSLRKRFKAIDKKYSGDITPYYSFPPKSDKLVFVCSQNDLFASNVSDAYIENIINACIGGNTYLFQTKNPARVNQFSLIIPENSIICTTIESDIRHEQMGNTPHPLYSALAMQYITFRKHVTIEPIMEFNLHDLLNIIRMCEPEQVNIGADSKRNNLPEPSKEKALELISELEKFTVVHQKSNLKRLLK
jgi:hypothetical protein